MTLIETSITMMCADVGTIKHLNQPTAHKYCVEWGTVARNRSRQAARAHVPARSSNSTPQSFKPVYFDTTLNNNNSSIGVN
ncbi:unnamed protein product [Anisakis simplex]|uniref:Uncharacterized protein n=1 Tax=Anisakis simplex TaxID=6269 RepID=A0A3P6N830_ANISI|nr:unnamed protein product [Anisakis simplex]